MLQGIETIRPGLGPQVQKAFLQNQNQFQLSPQQQQQQQQILAQVQGQGNMTNSPMYGGNMDTQRFTGLPRGPMNSKDGQQNANDGSIGSPMQSSSSKVRFLFSKSVKNAYSLFRCCLLVCSISTCRQYSNLLLSNKILYYHSNHSRYLMFIMLVWSKISIILQFVKMIEPTTSPLCV